MLAALGLACGGSGGGGGFFVATTPFSAQLLPLQIDDPTAGVATSSGAGDVAFLSGGDALVVGGGTDTVLRVSRTSGAVTEFGSVDSAVLVAIAVHPTTGAVYVGTDDGEIHEVDEEGSAFLVDVDDAGTGRVNGMAFAPSGFGDLGRQLVVASESAGLLAVDPDAEPVASTVLDGTAARWSDVAFLEGVLYALDRAAGEIRTVTAAGEVGDTAFATGFTAPDGMAADAVNRQLLVADPDTETLFAVSVPEPPAEDEEPMEDPVAESVDAIGRHDFDPTGPSGLAFDGVRNLLFVTRDLAQSGMTLRGVVLPPFASGFPRSVPGTNESFGQLAFDLDGSLVGVGNFTSTTPDGSANQVYRVRRNGTVATVRSGVGEAAAGEWLVAIGLDPATGTLYLGSDRVNVYALNDGGADLFATLPDLPVDVEGNEVITDLALAPANADAPLVGTLVVATSVAAPTGELEVGGSLYAIDLAAPDPPVLLGDAPLVAVPDGMGDEIMDGDLTGLLFASDGTLYVLGQDAGAIYEVTVADTMMGPEATFTAHATGLDVPIGLALDEGGRRFFVAEEGFEPGGNALREVPLAGGSPGAVLSEDFTFVGGFVPVGLAFDGLGDLFVVNRGSPLLRVGRFSAFPPAEE